ncbi:MAG: hypothetical protein LC775_09205, partial [Acidobacteria bacterium]|nr:hypothetical protein [Acidobacteriota bacterium]
VKDLPAEFGQSSGLTGKTHDLLLRGGSCVVGPDGNYIARPVFDEETILIAELDPAATDKGKMTLDVSGHYHRPDVFDLKLQRGSRLKAEEQRWRG